MHGLESANGGVGSDSRAGHSGIDGELLVTDAAVRGVGAVGSPVSGATPKIRSVPWLLNGPSTGPQRSTPYAHTMNFEPGQLWSDENGHARICGVVPVEGVEYAVLLRTRGAGGRRRRPFLFPVSSMLAGDDGWRIAEASEPRKDLRMEPVQRGGI